MDGRARRPILEGGDGALACDAPACPAERRTRFRLENSLAVARTKSVYLDLGAVCRKEAGGWQEGVIWPSSVHERPGVNAHLWEGYKAVIRRWDDAEIRKVLLASHLVPWELAQVLVRLKDLQRVREMGLTPVVSRHSRIYRALLEKSNLPGPLSFRKWQLQRARIKRLFRRPANIYLSCKHNLPSGKFPLSRWRGSEGRWVALHQPTPLCEEYMRALRGWVDVRLITTWFGDGEGTRFPGDGSRGIERATDDVLDMFAAVALRNGVELEGYHIEHCRKVVGMLLSRALQDLIQIREKIGGEDTFDYLGVSGTNYFSRILSLAVMEKGGRVTSFSHGGASCRYVADLSLSEFSTCTEFGVENSSCMGLFQNLLELYPTPVENRVKLFAVNYAGYRKFWENHRRQSPASKIKRVMVVSTAFYGDVGHQGNLPDLVKWDVELRIFRLLQAAGYTVLYKTHPGGVFHELRSQFLPKGIQVIAEPFEEVLDQADAFVYYFTDSTSMAAAVCARKPIVFIHSGFERWFEEPWELFKRRVRVVPAEFDDDNRMIFDESAFLRAVEGKPEEPDEGFLKKYFFPDGAA